MGSGAAIRLFHYWRSSASWRVRFGLAHKGVPAEFVAVNLLEGGADAPDHLARNPMGYVPVVELLGGDGKGPRFVGESIAILEWLEETFARAPLLPKEPLLRARVRQLCQIINSGTQPLINLGVAEQASADEAVRKAWQQHWIRKGLGAYEELVRETAGHYSVGDTLTMADIYLMPQIYTAARFDVGLGDYPTIARIFDEAVKLPAYQASHPDRYKPS